jgi:hypothetical protein
MPFAVLALLAGLWPIAVVHLAYLISVQQDWVPACFVYWDGCTSISRAARHGAANVFFKTAMLPYAVLLGMYWWRVGALGPGRRPRAVRALGLLASAFLVLYTVFLGVEGEIYQWLRRFGITVYFGGTVLAQMLLASLHGRRARMLVAVCALLLVLGLASIPLQHFATDRDAAVNALEWTYALLMMLGFLATARLYSPVPR